MPRVIRETYQDCESRIDGFLKTDVGGSTFDEIDQHLCTFDDE